MALRDVKETAVPIVLDKPRNIVFDLNAFSELEEIYGSMDAAFKAMQTGSMKAARTLLWAGLLHEDDALTVKQVGAMVTMPTLESVMNAISEALLGAMPENEAAVQPEEGPADPL